MTKNTVGNMDMCKNGLILGNLLSTIPISPLFISGALKSGSSSFHGPYVFLYSEAVMEMSEAIHLKIVHHEKKSVTRDSWQSSLFLACKLTSCH